MSDELLVTDEAILNTAKLYKETYELLEEDAKKILDMANLLEGVWKGDAYNKFIDCVPKMLEDFKDSGEMIKEMSEELFNYAENMASVDKEQASFWDEITDGWNSFLGNDLESNDISADDWNISEQADSYKTIFEKANDLWNEYSNKLTSATIHGLSHTMETTGALTGGILGYMGGKKQHKENYENNKQAWLENKKDYINKNTGYIEYQNNMNEMSVGRWTADNNACETIALYNALYHENGNKKVEGLDYPDIINKVEERGVSADGYFGTDPEVLKDICVSEGYDVDMKNYDDLQSSLSYQELQNNYDTYILTTLNEKGNPLGMVHTMCITKENNGKFVLHNAASTDEEKVTADSLEDVVKKYNRKINDGNVINESDPMYIMGIKKN